MSRIKVIQFVCFRIGWSIILTHLILNLNLMVVLVEKEKEISFVCWWRVGCIEPGLDNGRHLGPAFVGVFVESDWSHWLSDQ